VSEPAAGERIIRSRQNDRVREARRIARDPRSARREGLLVADGVVLVCEALEAGLASGAIFLDPNDKESESVRAACTRRGVAPVLAGRSVIDAISTLATPQGAVGIFTRPAHDPRSMLAAPQTSAPPLVAVLHGLQDPTNAGSLVRTALAAGLTGILSTEGTVDTFHPRAVRASMGACFRLPLACDVPPSQVWELLRRGGYRILALDPRGSIPLCEARLDAPTAILLGREGSGLEEEARAICEGAVRIPMASGVESLGVAAAGAIVFYALVGNSQK
jgi:TrmH family RNA methyltransferase